MPTSFYDTTVIDPTSIRPLGVQVLASSPHLDSGAAIDYELLLLDADRWLPLPRPSPSLGTLENLIAALADPSFGWQESVDLFEGRLPERWTQFALIPPPGSDARGFAQALLDENVVAAETSPLSKVSLANLAGKASLVGLYFAHEIPMLWFLGGTVGLVVIRPFWAGAVPEMESFGGDVAAVILDAIRARLGIKRRSSHPQTDRP